MSVKLIAFAALVEYVTLRPFIISPSKDYSNFIGFVLVHSILAYFGKINILGFDAKRQQTIFKYGAAGGAIGYAWMMFYIKYQNREIQHLFIANAMILLGVLYGARVERRKLPRSQREYGGGVNPSKSVPKGYLDPAAGFNRIGGCGGGGCG